MKLVELLDKPSEDRLYPNWTEEQIRGIKLIGVGNKKIGNSGTHAGVILKTVGIPVVDCPGASDCKLACFAVPLFLINSNVDSKWQNNKLYSYLAHKNPKKLLEKLTEELKEFEVIHELTKKDYAQIVLRIHEAGDFVSVKHILVYLYLAKRFPKIQFFGYSHNFHLKEQREYLEMLNSLPNVHVRESLDKGTKKTYYSTSYFGKEKPEGYIDCPEQTKGINCASCGICWRAPKAQIYFRPHGALRSKA